MCSVIYVQCTMYTLYLVHSRLRVPCTVSTVFCLYSVIYVYSVLCVQYHTPCTMYYAVYTFPVFPPFCISAPLHQCTSSLHPAICIIQYTAFLYSCLYASLHHCISVQLPCTLQYVLYSIHQTLSIWLGIQFRQRYGQIKDRRPNIFLNIFGLAWPWDPRGPETYSKFVQNPLIIDLWMEECQILMIFSYFSWKWRRSLAQD